MPDWTLLSHSSEHLSQLSDWGPHISLFAQTFEDNLGSDVSNALSNFIESGQVWALGIGFILGYIVRSLTAY